MQSLLKSAVSGAAIGALSGAGASGIYLFCLWINAPNLLGRILVSTFVGTSFITMVIGMITALIVHRWLRRPGKASTEELIKTGGAAGSLAAAAAVAILAIWTIISEHGQISDLEVFFGVGFMIVLSFLGAVQGVIIAYVVARSLPK